MAFLFIWQFIFSGPLEIASGYIGFSSYLRYLWPDVPALQDPATARWLLVAVAVAVGLLNIVLLYRRITSIAKITVSLWLGTLLTIAAPLRFEISNLRFQRGPSRALAGPSNSHGDFCSGWARRL